MIFNNFKSSTKKRRGLSSIVGALLFVVLMVSTFSVLGVALNSQSDIASTGSDVALVDLKKQQEDWGINVFANPPVGTQAELFIQVTNDGQNPVEISTVIVAEITDFTNDFPSMSYGIPVNLSLVSSGKQEHILPVNLILLDLADPLTTGVDQEIYTIKVISSLGTIQTYSIVCDDTICGVATTAPGQGSLSATLFLDGPNAINTKISTVIMFVTNTSEETVTDVQPFRGFNGNADCDTNNFHEVITLPPNDTPIVEEITGCSATSNLPVDLGPHEVAIFKWDFTVGGDIDTEFQFCNYAFGTDPTPATVDSQPDSCDEVVIIDPNDCGGCGPGGDAIILIDDLLIRPSIFMVIPSPFGATEKQADEKGIWGINVANPTDKDMEITKVTIVAYPPGGNSQDNVIASTLVDCLAEDIEPLKGPVGPGYWDCPRDNILVWDGLADPVLLQANSTKSFMVKVEPSQVKPGGTPANLDALIVQANVWSTFGSFGKAGYQSTMYLEKTSVVNVYLSDTTTSRSTIVGYQNDLAEMTSHNFIAVLADMDNDSTTTVNIGSRLIINIPREWVFDGFNENPIPGFVDPPTVTVHSDGSTQIIAETDVLVGDGTNDAIGIDFNAIAPDVNAPRLYVMYILADGTVTVAGVPKTIGPLNEIVLNVDP